MPLRKGKSKAAIGENIGIEEKNGKPPAQAVAIAYSEAGESKKKSKKHPYVRSQEAKHGSKKE